MTTIVTRAGKGSALTHNEVDSNFTNLNNAKYESGNNATFGTVGATTITGTSFSTSGNLTFTGTGNRITGDFSNATAANRVSVQSSTTNGNTLFNLIPNGTSTQSTYYAWSNSDTANASVLLIGQNIASCGFNSTKVGTGSYTPMTFATGGSERMKIDTSGNVGIGTSSPAQILDVVKSVAAGAVWGSFSNTNATAGSTGGILTSASGANNYSALYNVVGGITYLLGAGAGGLNISTSQAVPIVFNTSASERMRIDSSGNVGIGISTASAKLHVNGGEIRVSNADYGRVMFQRGSSALWEVGPRNTDDFYIRRETGAGNVIFEGGNVGIGTSSPSSKLDVNGGSIGQYRSTGDNLGLSVLSGSTSFNSYVRMANGTQSVDYGQGNGAAFVNVNNNQPWYVLTGGSERMRIDNNGNVGIGVTNASLKLEVAGNTQFSGWTIAGSTNSGGTYPPNTNVGIAFAWNFTSGGRDVTSMNNDTSGGGFRWEQRTGTSSSTFIGRTTNAGAWFKGDNSAQWATTSDARIKTNIREISGALDKITALHPCHFEYVDKIGKTKTGFIAQEFEQVLAGHVITEEFVPEVYRDLIPEDDGIKGIDADLIPYLTKAIQELSAKVDTLQAELNTLKGN